ncbi:hypothetical protein FHS01_005345 [Longimicrobium terrae]|uniref:Uncharacterized protein n=1 Tax=Longimicrobium terrae TaxID=1639882 RepID=A0A841H6B6_9BACT|nr:hypothetical protein [Longimicrobium terrae]MBB6073518.1 hypothetical protein [Longimicrobium terrae]
MQVMGLGQARQSAGRGGFRQCGAMRTSVRATRERSRTNEIPAFRILSPVRATHGGHCPAAGRAPTFPLAPRAASLGVLDN